ncbi:MAG: tetratricopeptide repeat protein [Promethearchaeota archaeon]
MQSKSKYKERIRLGEFLLISSQFERFQNVEHLMREGNLDEALHEVTHLEKNNKLTNDEQLACQLLKSQIFTQLGSLETGLQLVNQLLDQRQINQQPVLLLNSIITKGEVLRQMGKFCQHYPQLGLFNRMSRLDQVSKYLQLIEQGEQLLTTFVTLNSHERTEKEARLKLCKGIIYRMQDKLELSLEELQQSLTRFRELDDSEGIAESLANIGTTYSAQGDLDREFEYFQKSLTLYEEAGDKEGIANTYAWRFSHLYSLQKGRADLALEGLQKALDIFKDLNNKKGVAVVLAFRGDIYLRQGELDRGIENFQKAKNISQELGDKTLIAQCIFEIGWSYLAKGAIDTAVENFEKSMAIFEEVQFNDWMFFPLLNLGIIHRYQGNFDEAYKLLKKTLSMCYEYRSINPLIGNFMITCTLWALGLLALDMNSEEQLNNYLQQLDKQYARYKFPYISHVIHLLKAKSLKKSIRLKDKVKAQELLQQLVDQPVIVREWTVDAMIDLCDLITFELKTTGNEELLQEVKKLASRILEIAESQHSFSLHIESLSLQAKFAIIEGNLQTATDLLTQAETIATKQELHFLIEKVSTEKQQLEEEFEKWEQLIERNAPFQERLEYARMEEYIKEAQERTRLMG